MKVGPLDSNLIKPELSCIPGCSLFLGVHLPRGHQIRSCNLGIGVLSSSRFSCKLRVYGRTGSAGTVALHDVGHSKRVLNQLKEEGS